MFKGKKGSALRKKLIYAILILLATSVVFIYLLIQFKLSTERYNTEQVCRHSVKISAYKISGESLYNVLKCPIQYETIEATDDKTIKYEVAERMRKCWWMFHEGELELFEEGSENFCVICYVLDFKEKKKINGFVNYLLTHNVPLSQDVTYYDYLTPYSTTKELIQQTTGRDEDFIDTNQKYAVMFNYVEPGYISKLEAGEIGAATGAGVLIVGAVIISAPLSIPTIAVIGAGGLTGFYLGWTQGEPADLSGSIILWPYTEEEAARLHCEYAPAKTK